MGGWRRWRLEAVRSHLDWKQKVCVGGLRSGRVVEGETSPADLEPAFKYLLPARLRHGCCRDDSRQSADRGLPAKGESSTHDQLS